MSHQTGRGGMGSRKHGKSGHVHNSKHFTGKKHGKKVRRQKKLTARQRRKRERRTTR